MVTIAVSLSYLLFFNNTILYLILLHLFSRFRDVSDNFQLMYSSSKHDLRNEIDCEVQ